MGKGKKLIRLILFMLSAVLFAYSAYKLIDYRIESRTSSNLNDQLIEQAVSTFSPIENLVIETEPVIVETEQIETTDMSEQELPKQEVETAPISVDFDLLENDDVVGWIYCEDTPINYPVLQSDDNNYYLRRLINGEWNISGSIFMDYRNNLNNQDWNTIIYGHNMKNDTMFGTLPSFRDQAYYDEHPNMYFITPEKDYKIELVAGFVTPSDSTLYDVYLSKKDRVSVVEGLMASSDFRSHIETIDEDVRLLTLSTCSYEYDTARYVVIGIMTPVEKKAQDVIEEYNN